MKLKENIFLEETENENLKSDMDRMYVDRIALGRVFLSWYGIVLNKINNFENSEEVRKKLNDFKFADYLSELYEEYGKGQGWGTDGIAEDLRILVGKNKKEIIEFINECKETFSDSGGFNL